MTPVQIGHVRRTFDLIDPIAPQAAALVPTLRKLGARHVNYGVRDEHYDTVGAALLKTLEQGLGEAYTVEVHAAWIALYRVVSHTMVEAARGAVRAAA